MAACVMTFEARDSAAKVVPARFKMSTIAPVPDACGRGSQHAHTGHGSLRTSGSQTGTTPHVHQHQHQHQHSHCNRSIDRRALTQSFMHFSRGLTLNQHNKNCLKFQVITPLNYHIIIS